jgi:folate-dependent phosphoribosylglycinamide formyltransferase PurN
MLTPPLRIAVLCSRRAPGLLDLIERQPVRGSAFDVVAVVTSEPDLRERGRLHELGIPVLTNAIAEFYAQRGRPVYRDFAVRRLFDQATLARLAPFAPDLLVLDGYLYLLTQPILDAFPARVLNLHFSDLTMRHRDGRPLYPGPRAVRDAILDGQSETCATVHLVDQGADHGAPIVRSWPYPVSPLASRARAWQAADMLKAYAFAHQEWMMRGAAGPLLSAAITLITSARVDLDALAASDPATVAPWLVDERGRLTPPGAVHICERLWSYSSHEPHPHAAA